MNKQINDKERVAAALENPNLVRVCVCVCVGGVHARVHGLQGFRVLGFSDVLPNCQLM